MMDKKPSKCRFRVMKFEDNAISSSKNEMRTEFVKPAKVSRGSRSARAPQRTCSPDAQPTITGTITKQDRRSNRTVSKIPVKKIILNSRSNTITGELKRIFSSTNFPDLNSARNAHQVSDKAKKTKKKSKGKKKSNIPENFRRYEDTVTYNCETNKSPRRTRNEFLRYEQKRITPSMYYLSAGDSMEREICKAPRELKATDESCDCLPAEITYPNASHYKDSLSSRNSRKCTEDCTIWRVGEGKNLPICHCSSLNINLNRHNAWRNCICSTNKSGMPPVHPTDVDTTRPSVQTSTHADGRTSRFFQNKSYSKSRLPKNSTSGMFEKSAQSSKIFPKMCSTTNTADIGCNSRALASSSKNVSNKSPSSKTNSRSSYQLINYNFSTCKCDPVPSNPSCQCRPNDTCKCRSSNWTFKGRNSLTTGTEAQCLAMQTIGSVTETPIRRVSFHSYCPVLRSVSQNTKRSASTMPSFSSNIKAAYHKARTAITGTGDAPPTTPACVSVQTGGSPASTKLSHSVSCPVNDETDCHLLLHSPSEMPKFISGDTSDLCCSKMPRATQCGAPPASPRDAVQTENDMRSDGLRCNISCGSFPVKRTLECGTSPISCADAETGCLNDSCRAGPRRVYALFQPIFTRSTCYFYYIIYVIAMIACSPFVAIIYFCRVVTSPIRPSGYDCGEICPTCIPPRPCSHALISIFKSRQWFDKPTVCSHPETTTRPKTSSSSKLIRVECQQTSDSKFKTKHQGVIDQNSTSRKGKRTKKRQFQTYYSKISSKCSETRAHEDQKIPSKCSKPRSRQDHKISRCSECSKPPPHEVKFSNPPICEDKSSKRPPCEDKKHPSKFSKPRSCTDQITPSKRSKPSSNQNRRPSRQCIRPCVKKRKPCKSQTCKNRKCKLKNTITTLRCYFWKAYKKVVNFWSRNKPEEPTEDACLELSGPYEMLPPPPYYMYDSYLWRKSFFRARPKPRDSWYYYCTYIIAATFWCPLGLCLYFTFKCLGKCYG